MRADEAKLVPLTTALSSTVISGYVDVGAQYNIGNYTQGAGVPAGTFANKVDNFSLNNVDIALDKPQDESPWASGYHIDINAGTDAVGTFLNGAQSTTSSGTASVALRQAYVVIRTPIGNGIDWKVGVQDDIIGYEGNTDGANPNYTRSIGYFNEPTTLLGLIGSYKIVDGVTIQGGIADATTPAFGATSSDKTFAAALALTAPDSWGWAKGATLNLGTLLNIDGGGQQNYYAGLTVPTPLSILKVGAAFDLVSYNNQNTATNPHNDNGWVVGVYGVLQPTDKLSFNLRGEYYDFQGGSIAMGATGVALNPNYLFSNGKGEEVTATIQYNLWANVISRLEFRWDHADSGKAFGIPSLTPSYPNADSFLLAANLIYTF
ncbi:MAG TPA: outer membrane beta-barrel protein [Verrucomicrobiae bacterium]